MKRLGAVVCLAAFLLAVFYAGEFAWMRVRLSRELRRVESRLQAVERLNQHLAEYVFLQERASSVVYPDFQVHVYSSLGIPKNSDFPPLSATLHLSAAPARWTVYKGNLWVERLRAKSDLLVGVAIPVSRRFLDADDGRVALDLGARSARGPKRLLATGVFLPGRAGTEPGLFPLVLRYKVSVWTHVVNLALVWLLIVAFLRFLKARPPHVSKRELQLEEELAYLSRTYQDLSKSLRLERQKVESILNSAPDGILTCSPDGRLTFWNRSMETLTGLSKEEAVGRHCGECLDVFSHSGQSIVDPFFPCFREGKNLSLLDCRIEIRVPGVKGDGERSLPVALGAAPVYGADGSLQEVVVTIKDIRSQKEAEQMKQDVQAMITHDLRSPISAILGYAGLIQDPRLCKNEEDRQKYLSALVQTGKGMLILVSNLLSWAGMEEGKLVANMEPVRLKPILQETLESLEILAKPKEISVELEVSGDPWTITDAEKLKAILNNLVSNAIKFSRPGEAVRMTAAEAGEEVRLEIHDRGPGITAEEKERLFEKFSRVRKKGSGTGLGLYIVKVLAEVLEGRVEVASEIGFGSTFAVCLPVFRKETESAPAVPVQPRQLSLLAFTRDA